MVDTSDHQVSSRRSSNGKSNSVASMRVVSSIETRSTQSKVSPRGRPSSTSAVRLRIRASKCARLAGATMGCTALRCSSCCGGSMAMNIGSCSSGGGSKSVMPPCRQSDEKMAGLVSTCMMSW